MALLLAPLVVGVLAVSCCAAPLQGKPQAVVTFPGDLISTLPDLQLAEVRGARPRGVLLALRSPRGTQADSERLQARLESCQSP